MATDNEITLLEIHQSNHPETAQSTDILYANRGEGDDRDISLTAGQIADLADPKIIAEFHNVCYETESLTISKSNATVIVHKGYADGPSSWDGYVDELSLKQCAGTVTIVNTMDKSFTLKFRNSSTNPNPNDNRTIAVGEVVLMSTFEIGNPAGVTRYVQFQTLSYSGSNVFSTINVTGNAAIGSASIAGGSVGISSSKVTVGSNTEITDGQMTLKGERYTATISPSIVDAYQLKAGSAGIETTGSIESTGLTVYSATVTNALAADSATVTNALAAGSASVTGALSAGTANVVGGLTVGNAKGPLMKVDVITSEVTIRGDVGMNKAYPSSIFLNNLTSTPTGYAGGLCCCNGKLYFYDAEYQRWRKVTVSDT